MLTLHKNIKRQLASPIYHSDDFPLQLHHPLHLFSTVGHHGDVFPLRDNFEVATLWMLTVQSAYQQKEKQTRSAPLS